MRLFGRIGLVALAVLYLATISPAVHAYTSADLKKIRLNTSMFGDEKPHGVCGETDVETYGRDNLEIILRYFTDNRGLSLAAAAGIAGNIRAESRYNPNALQPSTTAPPGYKMKEGVGYGLVQWTTPKSRQDGLQKLADDRGVPISSISLQLDYIWQEMTTTRPTVGALQTNKDNPGKAAYDFHRIYEGSADTEAMIRENRMIPAEKIYKEYKGKISDGAGVVVDTGRTDTGGSCGTDGVGVGSGDYKDSGEVAGWANVLANSTATERLFGTSLVSKGHCAAIVSRVWRGANIGYGLNYANDMWRVYGSSKGHKDRSPKKGAILVYNSSNVAGHVMIYLGNNMVLNDGHVESASVEKDWHLQYLGWFDPNDLGWKSVRAADSTLLRSLGGYR